MDLSIAGNMIGAMKDISMAANALDLTALEERGKYEEKETEKLENSQEFENIETARDLEKAAESPSDLQAAQQLTDEASERTLKELYPKLLAKASSAEDESIKKNLIGDMNNYSKYRLAGGQSTFRAFTRREQYKRDVAALKDKKFIPRKIGEFKSKLANTTERWYWLGRGEK